MAISDDLSSGNQDSGNEITEILDEASERILKGNYEQGYDILSTEVESAVKSTERTSYRDEQTVANILDKEALVHLSCLAAGEPSPRQSLDDSKIYVEDYFSERKWKD